SDQLSGSWATAHLWRKVSGRPHSRGGCTTSVGSRRTIAIEYRCADGRSDRLAEIAAELARLKVDIIGTGGTPPVMAQKQAAPGVFAAVGDPVGIGIVASLARPGGTVTGVSALTAALAGKRLELLRELVPNLRRLAIMGNVGNPLTVLELGELQAAARPLGLQLDTLESLPIDLPNRRVLYRRGR